MAFESHISIHLLSDLHLEIDRGEGPDYENFRITPKADILALLGDIGTLNEDRLFRFLRQQTRQFSKVLYLPGNHEFYHSNYDDAIHKLDAFASQCNEEREKDCSIGEFIVLNRTRVDLSSTLTILGATLWSHLNPDDLDFLRRCLSDLKRIKGFTADRFTELHKMELSWLNAQVEQIRANEQTRSVIIFTHHAPTMGTADPKYAGGPTESAFATELTNEPCWGPPVKVWAFGHTHWSCDIVKKEVRVVSNQRGYSRPGDKGWNPEFVLKLHVISGQVANISHPFWHGTYPLWL